MPPRVWLVDVVVTAGRLTTKITLQLVNIDLSANMHICLAVVVVADGWQELPDVLLERRYQRVPSTILGVSILYTPLQVLFDAHC